MYLNISINFCSLTRRTGPSLSRLLHQHLQRQFFLILGKCVSMCDIPVISSFLVPERCSPHHSLFCSAHPSFSSTLTHTLSSVLPTRLLREPDSAGLLGQLLANSVQRSRQCAPARTTGRFHELRL